ncbi:MAG TPA: hypothetical protein VM432_09605 [Bdellovibrionales bacterium]|nr:hypothetical protein [Bdellovibrionales bacterium]
MSNSASGFITIDFLFAFVIAMGFSTVLFAISFTLAMVEVGQYVTYAASRSFNPADATLSLQEANGIAKFNELVDRPVLKRILSSGWISLKSPMLADFSEEYGDDDQVFVGAQVQFEAKVLNFNVPFLGSTSNNPSTGKATLNSYLMREPSSEECRESFNRRRYEKLLELDDNYRQAKADPGAVLVTDNGC